MFEEVRSESKPGRQRTAKKRAAKGGSTRKLVTVRDVDVSNAALSKRIAKVERALVGISKQLQQLMREVKKPVKVTIGG